MHPKYHNGYYWENLIRSRKLTDTFNNMQITADSAFFYGVVYNSFGRRKMIEDVIHFATPEALSGYLYYVYLPTAFLSFTNEEKGLIVPLGLTLPDLIGYVCTNDFVRYHGYQRPMEQILELADQLIGGGPVDPQGLLVRLEGLFNYSFQIDRDAYAMMHVYRSPQELGQYFAGLYQIDGDKHLGAELFYHRTGLRKAEWEALYQSAGDNIFSSRKFMNCISNLLHTG